MTRPNPVKRIIKRSLQRASARYGRHTRPCRHTELLVLMYHRILPDDDDRAQLEEPGMVVTPESFRLHINILNQYFDIIQLSDWPYFKQKSNSSPRRLCAITFDDGWADNYEFAFPVLKEAGIPATIFVVSDMIGTDQVFWPEQLVSTVASIARNMPAKWSHRDLNWLKEAKTNYQFGLLPPSREEQSELIAHAKFLPDDEIIHRLNSIAAELGLPDNQQKASLLSWEQLAEMTDSGLVESGSHTCRHVRLTDSAATEIVDREVTASKRSIERHTGHKVNTFCYPNGDYTEHALDVVRENYQLAVTTQQGWNTPSTDDYLLHRIGIHEDIANDETAFLSRISGWL